ncbi:MAG TPA: methionyl-tRNA formyltransferase [Dehalococcoidia bacterium]|nr:methionyl-tRNA formyltransferase [Dehalococcoidia bacterium]
MRVVFMGSPEFALPTLRRLLESQHEVVAVVTQPDRPAGRGHRATAPPVKVLAQERGVPVLQPANVSSPLSVERLRALEPDAIIVAAYGQILRERVLELPRRGCLNVHASLLPRHRGASPVVAAILAGDEITGVSIMEMVRALDAGPVVATAEEPISPHDTAGTLEARLAEKGAALLLDTLDPWAQGLLRARPQDDSQATYAPMVRRGDALIDWSRPAVEIWRAVRAYNPWPVAFTRLGDEELRILEAWPLEGGDDQPPGTVLPPVAVPAESGASGVAPVVQTGEGRLALLSVQRAGKRATSGAEFARGHRGFIGAVLGGHRSA